MSARRLVEAFAIVLAAVGDIANASATVAVIGEVIGWWDLL